MSEGNALERGNEGGAGRPATELERLGDELAQVRRRLHHEELRHDTTRRVLDLTRDELARHTRPPAVQVDELIEALRDACAFVLAPDHHVAATDEAVARWIRTIERARGRIVGARIQPAGQIVNAEARKR